jgi:hypothetical protein
MAKVWKVWNDSRWLMQLPSLRTKIAAGKYIVIHEAQVAAVPTAGIFRVEQADQKKDAAKEDTRNRPQLPTEEQIKWFAGASLAGKKAHADGSEDG